jgi:hypothetical protein
MALYLAPIINGQQVDVDGKPLNGGFIKVYLADSSTPATTYNDEDGVTQNTWPIVLNTLGVNAQGAIWLTGGAAYKFVIENSAGVVQRSGSQLDNISGINDTTSPVDQWVSYQGAPIYVSATSFTVTGDQTSTFQIGRRVKTQNTGGVVYSTITASVYSAPNTTVTLTNDSGTLDSGLQAVHYGVISAQNSSLPIPLSAWTSTSRPVTASSGTLTDASAELRYRTDGKTVFFNVVVTILTNGTGAGTLVVTLPWTAVRESGFGGRESQAFGWAVGATIGTGTNTLVIAKYDNTYPGGNSHRIAVSGVFEIA